MPGAADKAPVSCRCAAWRFHVSRNFSPLADVVGGGEGRTRRDRPRRPRPPGLYGHPDTLLCTDGTWRLTSMFDVPSTRRAG